MKTQTDELNQHIVSGYGQIIEAAKNHDLAAVQRYSRRVAELEDLKHQHQSVQQRLATLSSKDGSAASPIVNGQMQTNGKSRELPIEVTEGMIRQNLLTLTPHVKRGKIMTGEDLAIEALPSGERFTTVLLQNGNKLRARGEIAQFYRDARVKSGDYVVLTEISPRHWTLTKAPPGKYGFQT
jgi:hypothetical protein